MHAEKGLGAADPTQCGYVLGAELDPQDPVRSLILYATDLGVWADRELKASAWVEQLQQEAEQARIGRGAGPRL